MITTYWDLSRQSGADDGLGEEAGREGGWNAGLIHD